MTSTSGTRAMAVTRCTHQCCTPSLAEPRPRTFFSGSRMGSCFLRSEEHTSELKALMRISYAVFCLTKQKRKMQRIEKKHQNRQYMHIRIHGEKRIEL